MSPTTTEEDTTTQLLRFCGLNPAHSEINFPVVASWVVTRSAPQTTSTWRPSSSRTCGVA